MFAFISVREREREYGGGNRACGGSDSTYKTEQSISEAHLYQLYLFMISSMWLMLFTGPLYQRVSINFLLLYHPHCGAPLFIGRGISISMIWPGYRELQAHLAPALLKHKIPCTPAISLDVTLSIRKLHYPWSQQVTLVKAFKSIQELLNISLQLYYGTRTHVQISVPTYKHTNWKSQSMSCSVERSNMFFYCLLLPLSINLTCMI